MPPETEPLTLPPHPTLGSYYAAPEEKRRFVSEVFDQAAGDYDRVENLMAFGTGRWYRRQALLRAGLSQGMRVLDVAVGTGLIAREEIALTGASNLILGVDPSLPMMRQAVSSLGIRAVQGIGERLPLADSQFDFVSMGYALRHLADIRPAFAEFHRVLKPGGRVCILEISRPASAIRRGFLKMYMRYIVPMIANFGRGSRDSRLLWRYYWDTIDACVPPAKVLDCLTQCGFVDVQHKMVMGMFSEYTGRKAESTH